MLASEKLTQITDTAFMEYSPMTSPDNQSITFVRDGDNPNQTIWKMNRKTKKDEWAITTLEPVGYYVFNHKNSEVLFWSRFGFNVTHLNLNTKTEHFVLGHAIPSSPKLIPSSDNFSFVHRQTNEAVWIKGFNPKTRAIQPIAPLTGTNFDYSWTNHGDILSAQGTILFLWLGQKQQWQKVMDLKDRGFHRISRIAISSNGKKLALVDNL